MNDLLEMVKQYPQHPWLLKTAAGGLGDEEFDQFLDRRVEVLQMTELLTLWFAVLVLERLVSYRPGRTPFRNPMVIES